MKKDKAKLLNLILPGATILCIFALWAAIAAVVGSEYVLPSIGATFSALVNLLGEKSFYIALSFTLLRTLIAFIVSYALAFLLATLSALKWTAERVIAPIMGIIRALPTIAVVLLLLFWTNSFVAPIIVTMLVVLPTTYTQIKNALLSVDKTTVEAGFVDGANVRQAFFEIRLPQALSSVYESIGSGFALNLKLMVAAEVLAATANSLGYLLNTSKVYFEMATMIALVVVAVILGVIVERIFSKLSEKVRI